MKNSLKTQILIALSFLAWSQVTEAQWTEVSSQLADQRGIIEMTAPNLKTCYATVYDRTSTIYPIQMTMTHDGGKTWHSQKLDSLKKNFVVDIVSTSSRVVHVLGWNYAKGGGNIFRSIDGGQTWQRGGANTYTDPASFPDDMFFFNANDGVVFGDPLNGSFEIYTTSDGGNSWNQVSSDKIPAPLPNEYGGLYSGDVNGKSVWTISLVYDENGFLLYGRLLRSDDKGKSWYVINSNVTIESGNLSIRFRDSLNGLYKDNGILYRTTDGGATWNVVTYTGTFFSFDFDNVPGVPGCWISTGGEPNFESNSMYGIGSSVSYDDGNSWTTLDTGVNHTCIEMVSKNGGFTGGISSGDGTDGAFYYSGAPLKTASNNSLGACDVIEMNVYPNPSTESFSLTINASSAETVLIRVYNMQGLLMMTEKFNPAEVFYFGDDLSPGLYLAEIFVGNEKRVIRLMKQ